MFLRRLQHKYPAGFTLVEELVVLALAGILVTAAIPSMARLFTRSEIETAANHLAGAARTARTTAITHNTDVLLCASDDGTSCSGSSIHWHEGWIVALDRNGDLQPDAVPLASSHTDTHGARIVGSVGRDHVRFRPNGSAAGTNLSLVVCPRHASHGTPRTVIVANSGRIRQTRANTAQQQRCQASPAAAVATGP